MKDFFKEMAPYLVSLVIILYLYFEGKFVFKTFGNKYSSIEHLLYYYSLCTLFLVMVALYKSKLKHEKFKFLELKDFLIYVPMTAIWITIILFGFSIILKYIQ